MWKYNLCLPLRNELATLDVHFLNVCMIYITIITIVNVWKVTFRKCGESCLDLSVAYCIVLLACGAPLLASECPSSHCTLRFLCTFVTIVMYTLVKRQVRLNLFVCSTSPYPSHLPQFHYLFFVLLAHLVSLFT